MRGREHAPRGPRATRGGARIRASQIVAALAGGLVLLAVRAQGGPPADPSAPSTPAPPSTSAPASPAAEQLSPVEITGSRPDDVQERRQSTAAKIIIGREEI